MPFTDPQTVNNPTAGAAATAAWGDAVRDATVFLATGKPHARVYNSASINHTSSGSFVAVTFDSERYDVGGCHSTASNTSRLTIPSGEDGKYRIGGTVVFAASTASDRGLGIMLNGTTYIAQQVMTSNQAGSQPTVMQVSTDYALVAGDYVQLMAMQRSGGTLAMTAVSAYAPEFWIAWFAT